MELANWRSKMQDVYALCREISQLNEVVTFLGGAFLALAIWTALVNNSGVSWIVIVAIIAIAYNTEQQSVLKPSEKICSSFSIESPG